jgi:hypothetical protein
MEPQMNTKLVMSVLSLMFLSGEWGLANANIESHFVCSKRREIIGSDDNDTMNRRIKYYRDLDLQIESEKELLFKSQNLSRNLSEDLLFNYIKKIICIADYDDSSGYFENLNNLISVQITSPQFNGLYQNVLNKLSGEEKLFLQEKLESSKDLESQPIKP